MGEAGAVLDPYFLPSVTSASIASVRMRGSVWSREIGSIKAVNSVRCAGVHFFFEHHGFLSEFFFQQIAQLAPPGLVSAVNN